MQIRRTRARLFHRSRLSRLVASAAWVLTGTVACIACTQTGRNLGDDCLNNNDCASGMCANFHCSVSANGIVQVPPSQDASDDHSSIDADADALSDVGGDSDAASGQDSSDAADADGGNS